jgi:hypothetical protein
MTWLGEIVCGDFPILARETAVVDVLTNQNSPFQGAMNEAEPELSTRISRWKSGVDQAFSPAGGAVVFLPL